MATRHEGRIQPLGGAGKTLEAAAEGLDEGAMNNASKSQVNRRGVLKGSAAMLGGALLAEGSYEETLANVRTESRPSELKIADLRVAVVEGQRPILRLDTNQDIYGLGEVRDGASPRSEEHTSELQSLRHLVCRLLLEKKKDTQ